MGYAVSNAKGGGAFSPIFAPSEFPLPLFTPVLSDPTFASDGRQKSALVSELRKIMWGNGS
jgi:hypothetical protein